jgi:hypothetical protein
VHSGRTGTRRREYLGIGRRDALGVETAKTLREGAGTAERLFIGICWSSSMSISSASQLSESNASAASSWVRCNTRLMP